MANRLRGEKSTNWKGGRIEVDGYVYIFIPNHPNARKNGYLAEHRLVMSKLINRPLYEDEIVHHIDENRGNNNPENLRLERTTTHKHNHIGSRVFSEEQLVKIRDEYRQGASSITLAKKHHCSPQIILYWIKSGGMMTRTPGEYRKGRKGASKLNDKQAKESYEKYLEAKTSVLELARKYGMSSIGLVRMFNRRGWKTGRNKFTSAKKNLWKKL